MRQDRETADEVSWSGGLDRGRGSHARSLQRRLQTEAVVRGLVHLSADEVTDVGWPLHAGKAARENEFAHFLRDVEGGFEDVGLRRID